MAQAHAQLNCEYGLAADGAGLRRLFDERVRGTTTYPPGAKENGGIFCHANTWAIVAAAKLGQGDLAYQYYRQICRWPGRTRHAHDRALRLLPEHLRARAPARSAGAATPG